MHVAKVADSVTKDYSEFHTRWTGYKKARLVANGLSGRWWDQGRRGCRGQLLSATRRSSVVRYVETRQCTQRYKSTALEPLYTDDQNAETQR